jgi:predicted unusual protein kinase regulating ubiquinone biosynthesis (AarF/ABC1/UbiB family)
MTANVAGNYTKSKIKTAFQSQEDAAREWVKTHKESGEVITQTLGELKGAVMKVGQMASAASDLLPPEVAAALTSLQREAPPMEFEVIAAQIERELGAHPAMLFDWFDEEPFAAASIGQVHRARTDDGREVVVKVQYPGVDESCDSDLSHLKLTLRASGLVQMHRKAFETVFEELRERIHEELDYCNEADNVRLFRQMHADDEFMVVPEVVGERSAQRVLTLTYEEGDPIGALHDEPYNQEIRDQIGVNLFKMIGRQIFRDRTIHGDPNPGNYAFRPDGRIVLYDYGCVKKLEPEYVETFREIVRCSIAGNYDAIDGLMFALKVRPKGSPPVPSDFYQMWVEVLLDQVLDDRMFDYRESRHHEQVLKLIPASLKYRTSFQPNGDIVMVDRVIIGLHNNFRTIGPVLPWLELLTEAAEMPSR